MKLNDDGVQPLEEKNKKLGREIACFEKQLVHKKEERTKRKEEARKEKNKEKKKLQAINH